MECHVCQNEGRDLRYCSNPTCLNMCHEECMYEDKTYNARFCSVDCCQAYHTQRLPNSDRKWGVETMKEYMALREDMADNISRAEQFFNEHRRGQDFDAKGAHEAGNE